jgi:hypothetical protein
MHGEAKALDPSFPMTPATSRPFARWLVIGVSIQLSLLSLAFTLFTFLLVAGVDYSLTGIAFLPFTLGMGLVACSFSATFLLFRNRNLKGLLWFVPVLLAPVLWILVAMLFELRFELH